MSEDQVIRHCAPTLAGLKTGNIFNASYENEEELKASLAAFNEILTARGLRIACLRAGGGRALVYLYRPQSLLEDLSCLEAKALLQQFAQFTKCTGVYMKCLHCGAGLAKLAVRRSAKAGQNKEEQ